MSSSDISIAADMFADSKSGFRATTKGSDEIERGSLGFRRESEGWEKGGWWYDN